MIRIDIETVINIIQEVAEEHVLPHFGRLQQGDIAFKIGDDPVTIADKNTESALSARLLDLLPGSKVVGEEAFSSNKGLLAHFSDESPVWIIDPIDGTRNFVKSSSDFGVIVALAEQNQTIAGWIYHPTSREVVSVEKGAGAYYRGQRLKIAPVTTFTDMHGYLGDLLTEDFDRYEGPRPPQPRFHMMTAGAVEYPRLVLDIPHFGNTKPQSHFRATMLHSTPWDDAAGVLMHQEAGGYSAFWSGEAYRPSIMHKGLALAPDKDSWHQLKDWCSTFAKLPA